LNEDWSQRFSTVSDEWGSWSVSVAGAFNLDPGTSGMAEVADTEGNATWIDWHVPNPRIIANLDENWVALQSFTSGAFADITVVDLDGSTVLWTAAQVALDGNGTTR
jgi:hypothetical protein